MASGRGTAVAASRDAERVVVSGDATARAPSDAFVDIHARSIAENAALIDLIARRERELRTCGAKLARARARAARARAAEADALAAADALANERALVETDIARIRRDEHERRIRASSRPRARSLAIVAPRVAEDLRVKRDALARASPTL